MYFFTRKQQISTSGPGTWATIPQLLCSVWTSSQSTSFCVKHTCNILPEAEATAKPGTREAIPSKCPVWGLHLTELNFIFILYLYYNCILDKLNGANTRGPLALSRSPEFFVGCEA